MSLITYDFIESNNGNMRCKATCKKTGKSVLIGRIWPPTYLVETAHKMLGLELPIHLRSSKPNADIN